MTLADQIAVMDAGQIQQVGEPTFVYANPRNVFVADFLGSPSMNFLEGDLREGEAGLVIDYGSFEHDVPEAHRRGVESHVGESLALGVRPENVTVAERGQGYPATVEVVKPQGEKTVLELAVGGDRSLNASVEPDVDVSVDEEIRIAFDRSKLHYFDPSTGESLTFAERTSDAADPVATER